jgi:DNA-binding beta-propeller fold protein YncE
MPGGKPMRLQASRVQGSLLGLCLLAAATDAVLAEPFALVTGRRDPRIYAIDLAAALKPANNNTGNAIISRSWVSPRRLDGVLLGDPANIVLSPDHKTAFVMNHHGQTSNTEFSQHGARASVSLMDVKKMLQRSSDNNDVALQRVMDGGWFGGVGLLPLGNLLLTSASEGWLSEDGSNRISIIDVKSGALVGQIQMPVKGQGVRQLRSDCPDYDVPWKGGPPPAVPYLAPSKQFGCWPDPESLALGKGSDGKSYLFSGNAGTEDVSVMDLNAALKGNPVVEVAARIPVQSGPFGIAASPNGKLIAVTARESNLEDDAEGNTISIIDVDLARQGKPGAEAARVQVGTDDPKALGRPFAVAWTPDGKEIVVANFRTNNVSIVDVDLALGKKSGAEAARIALTRADGQPARPKGVAVTADGHYAVVAGGANTIKASATNLTGTAFVIDLQKKAQVATVANVGIDPYGVAILDKAPK